MSGGTATLWEVYLNGELIDEVWFHPDCETPDVLEILVEWDGYHPKITVKKVV